MKLKLSFFCFLFLSLFVLFFVSGCGEEPVATAPVSTVKKSKPTKNDTAKKTIEANVEAEPLFEYSSIGQRDPFESLLRLEKEGRSAVEPQTPLEKFDLGQFRVQAILIGKGEPRAMVNAPDGKNYILKPGLKIGKNRGVIKTITKTSIVVEESSADYLGNPIKGLQTIDIPQQKSF